ncbi:uncharacterized protein BDR25DRAFT_361594 [Lindgomyces ingoldianus]|uniref:Uncharacterized protein n=1 Tax=Lindgomyces ingoldianus TaxID=673940 RepID=A0ACB6QDS2_9PLEO|nr:uncharacterized protein BDR25DRAFT_361594 [Lindgomyces ingoldianus]KAF2464517.1 hypothetical protein BDR25DRAFT_361594 [Lindgomyces ingoldianus]
MVNGMACYLVWDIEHTVGASGGGVSGMEGASDSWKRSDEVTLLSKRVEGSPYIHRASEHTISRSRVPQPRLSVYATEGDSERMTGPEHSFITFVYGESRIRHWMRNIRFGSLHDQFQVADKTNGLRLGSFNRALITADILIGVCNLSDLAASVAIRLLDTGWYMRYPTGVRHLRARHTPAIKSKMYG